MHAVTQPAPSAPPASLDPDAAAGGRLVAPDGRTLPLRSAHLSVEARGGIARVVLTQRFANLHAEPIGVRYLLPLPARAAVAGFAFTLGDTRVVGEVQPRKTARAMFEKAIVQGRTAALVEEERSTLFTQRVGNIPAGAEVICEITLDQQLAWLDEGAWAWRFPTVVGPRYTGGITADAARISVPVSMTEMPARASLELSIGDALTGAVVSPSHAITVEADDVPDEPATAVRLAGAAALDRDVVVRWPVAAPSVGVGITAARPADPAHQNRTYGLLTLVPPSTQMTPRARDLTLLIDTSGSMGGQPLDQAKRVMKALVERLGDRDRVEMISFGSRPVRFRSEPIAATKNGKKAALKWLRKLSASGGTEMHTAILEALRPLRADAQRQIVLVTDGYIGFEQAIIQQLLHGLPADCRLHTIGVGSAPNRTLTEGAARAGRGTELIIGLGEDPAAAADRMVARTADPLVTELTVTGPGLAEMAPMRLPDLYAGAPALVGVACGGAGPLTVRGRTADGVYEHTVEVPKLALGEGAQGVTALFGRNRVDDLEMRLTAGEPSGAIDAEIERTGVAFGIATRKTSWIAITEDVTVDPGEHREIEQPHHLPHGASIEGFGLRAPAGPGGGGSATPILARGMAPPAPGGLRLGLSGALLAKRKARSKAEEPRMRRPAPAREERARDADFDDEGGAADDRFALADLEAPLDPEMIDAIGDFGESEPSGVLDTSELFDDAPFGGVSTGAGDVPLGAARPEPAPAPAEPEPAPEPAPLGDHALRVPPTSRRSALPAVLMLLVMLALLVLAALYAFGALGGADVGGQTEQPPVEETTTP